MKPPSVGPGGELGPVVTGPAVKAGEVRVGSAAATALTPSGAGGAGGAGVDVDVRMAAVEEHEAEESAPESGFVGFLRYAFVDS